MKLPKIKHTHDLIFYELQKMELGCQCGYKEPFSDKTWMALRFDRYRINKKIESLKSISKITKTKLINFIGSGEFIK